jgi:hypothetical protein
LRQNFKEKRLIWILKLNNIEYGDY